MRRSPGTTVRHSISQTPPQMVQRRRRTSSSSDISINRRSAQRKEEEDARPVYLAHRNSSSTSSERRKSSRRSSSVNNVTVNPRPGIYSASRQHSTRRVADGRRRFPSTDRVAAARKTEGVGWQLQQPPPPSVSVELRTNPLLHRVDDYAQHGVFMPNFQQQQQQQQQQHNRWGLDAREHDVDIFEQDLTGFEEMMPEAHGHFAGESTQRGRIALESSHRPPRRYPRAMELDQQSVGSAGSSATTGEDGTSSPISSCTRSTTSPPKTRSIWASTREPGRQRGRQGERGLDELAAQRSSADILRHMGCG